jgi:hypothetical protein
MKWFVHAIHSVVPLSMMVGGFAAFNGTLGKRFRENRLVQIVSFVWLVSCVVLLVIFIGWGHF